MISQPNLQLTVTGVRKATAFSENPFMFGALSHIEGKRKNYVIANKIWKLTDANGQDQGSVQHSITKIVDDTQFVKVFAEGIEAMYDLSSPGSKVFRLLFNSVQKRMNEDRIYLSNTEAAEPPYLISKAVFFRGITELLSKGFLAKSTSHHLFYLNPAMLWNGDRVRFIREFQRAPRNITQIIPTLLPYSLSKLIP